jgi:hypothetical protein
MIGTHAFIDSSSLNKTNLGSLTQYIRCYDNLRQNIKLTNKLKNKFKTTQEILHETYNIDPGIGHTQLPRAMIYIKDSALKRIAMEKNPDYYSKIDENKVYNDTIDNIKVEDVPCPKSIGPHEHGSKKILFEKILDIHGTDTTAMGWGNCHHTIFAAAKRQLRSAPMPSKEMAQDFLQFSKRFINKYVGEDLKHFGYSYADWFNHLPKRKQDNMIRIQQALNQIHNSDMTTRELLELFAMHYQAICKVEIQELDGKPRMVCSIPDLIKYVMGPVTWHLEELMAKKFPGYCGGKNLTEMEDEINELIDKGFDKVVEGDGSAFDNTQDISLKQVDHYIYEQVESSVYHVPNWIFRMVSHLYYKIMDVNILEGRRVRTIMTYHVLGTVFSGDCDTTLANTLRMALYNHYTCYKAGLRLEQDYYLFSKGDDFSVLFRSKIPDTLIRQAYDNTFLTKYKPTMEKPTDTRSEKLGQICKFLEIGRPDSFKFCSLRSWYKDIYGHITLTRNPQKLFTLAQYSRKTKTMSLQQRYNYLLDQAQALDTTYKGITIFDTMSALYKQHAEQLKNYTTQPIKRRIIKGDQRINILTNIPGYEDVNLEQFYHIKHREKQIKIGDDYWETMKYIENQTTRLLSEQEAKIVNAQIEAEFSSNELHALLTVNKTHAS